MNISQFDDRIAEINIEIGMVNFLLEIDEPFDQELRLRFNHALERALVLLRQDAAYKTDWSTRNWHVARRFVKYHKLRSNIEKVRSNILRSKSPPYFTKKIKDKILPPIARRIEDIHAYMGSKERLPFGGKKSRNRYRQQVKSELALQDPEKTEKVEREFVHLLANHFDDSSVKQINIESYTGSSEIYGVISWSEVLTQFIEKGDQSEKRIGNYLLAILHETEALALKMSYADDLLQTRLADDHAEEVNYYKDLVKFFRGQEVFPSSMDIQDQFLLNHNLKKRDSVPANVLFNEIAWDIVESITNLKSGESRIVQLGTKDHSIVVQVRCLQVPSTDFPEGKYEYQIINTGSCVRTFHKVTKGKDGNEIGYPLIFKQVPKSAFTYSFFAEAVRLSLQVDSVPAFYQLHHYHFVAQARGRRTLDSSWSYPLQKHGTCVYAALEAWIDSHLTPQQCKHLEIIKTEMAIAKQEEVVQFFEAQDEITSWVDIVKGNATAHPASITHSKKLEESMVLLQSGVQYLMNLS